MFWRDEKSLNDYNSFGDVLVFDNIYETNIYGKPLAVFVGSNTYRGMVLFGCALLVDETKETYNWVLTTFLTSTITIHSTMFLYSTVHTKLTYMGNL